MINITDTASFDRALDAPIAPEIKRLLVQRRDQLLADTGGEYDLGELAYFIVVEHDPPDSIAAIEAAARFPVITDPAFEGVHNHGGWFEAVTILSDDGYGVVLFVPDDERVEATLIGLLRAQAVPTQVERPSGIREGAPATR